MMGLFVFPNAAYACEFWEAVIYKEAITEKERIEIAVQFVRDGKAELAGFNGTEAELVETISKAFKVMQIKPRIKARHSDN